MEDRTIARAPLSFATHAPQVVATVAGVETRFVVDTGSEVHLLTKELVDRLGLRAEEGEEGVDPSGATMPSWSVEDVVLDLADAALPLTGVVSIPAPAPFPALGVGGILSPQHLHESAVSVLDLERDELLLVDADPETLRLWLEERNPELTTVLLEREPSYPAVVIRAAIRPHDPVPTLLDTGGKRTQFARGAVPGISPSHSERLGSGVSGTEILGAGAGAQTLVVGGHEIQVEALAVRDEMHGTEGLVGMDVLRGTVLACAADRARPVVWQVTTQA